MATPSISETIQGSDMKLLYSISISIVSDLLKFDDKMTKIINPGEYGLITSLQK